MAAEQLRRLVDEIQMEVIEWRRYLHRYPELSYQEEKTAQFVCDTLTSFGGLELSRPTQTSVMARLRGARPGPVIAIRADMDALPIAEENTFDFVSQNPGVMHACGHDGHTAMLLGTAKILSGSKSRLNGEVRFLFQHAEESPPGGAEEMVRAGVLDGVDMIVGAHLWSPLEYGKIGILYGPAMAAGDSFTIRIHGKGGHAAMPHLSVDSIAVAAQVVSNLQQIVSRNTDPLETLVLSITKFQAGTAFHVIPGTVEIFGTVRYFQPEFREQVPPLMERIVKGIAEAHGASYEFRYDFGYRAVINDEEVTRQAEAAVREYCGENAIERMAPVMAAEDFSSFQQKTPGCFLLIGAGNKEKGITFPHHHPRFTIDEDALAVGVGIFARLVERLCLAP
ncbi:M20 family metallopeptidase [Brevibacillus borstelensis]|uniref:M20 family metallopeptidase n=1 Tax=Brevibacillus borstelensis TaxID=45462 RepID=UPI00046A062B|nr:M20 family metallopeptidase [Brevibacillus borstelensis]MCC0567335.1 M20 family metallopeptidase [Brevibacillus borstelensis]MCM3472134.1 M20 family metallopeptidase [Brevibacillus borstelensis]MCM3561822.1 M20 family metallopeptidase [Brevibacillus borstelensis]MED1855058.1 M20 family metallopeptidase [Brevibacillus borstelensis]